MITIFNLYRQFRKKFHLLKKEKNKVLKIFINKKVICKIVLEYY